MQRGAAKRSNSALPKRRVSTSTRRRLSPSQHSWKRGLGRPDQRGRRLHSAVREGYIAIDAKKPDPVAPGVSESAGVDSVRGTETSLPGTPRIAALGIADRIERVGRQALVGQVAYTPDALAELAQVNRDVR